MVGLLRCFDYVFIICAFFISSCVLTVLNIEELNSVHYTIDIVNNPVLKHQDWTTDIVTVTNKYGQEYICTLPEVQIPENENKKEEDLLDQLVDISELLKPMEAAPCLIKKKDWWSYEFCFGSVIKQYHLEDNKVVGTILILGKYESEYNWKNNSKAKNKLQKFHIQSYVNGTRCDITGVPRRAEVRFHCEEGAGDYIQQVDEPESCRYVVIIATTRVCHHPYLKPSPNRTPHNINCAPALNEDEYARYQGLQEAKKLRMEQDGMQFENEISKSGSNFDSNGDLVNAVGDNETDEESKWSIQLVTIPVSKNIKIKDSIQAQASNSLFEETLLDTSESATMKDVDEEKAEGHFASQHVKTRHSYLSEDELLEKELGEITENFAKEEEDEENDDEKEEENDDASIYKLTKTDTVTDEEKRRKSVEKQFQAFRARMEKLMKKWMQIQNEDHIRELLEKIKFNLDENVQQLQETANKYSEDSISSYLNDLVAMAENYQNKLPKTDDFHAEDKQKLLDALHSLSDILSEAEVEVLKAIDKRKKLERMEKYLESQLQQAKGATAAPEDSLALETPADGTPDSATSFPASSNPSPPTSKRFKERSDEEDRITGKENTDVHASDHEKEEEMRHVKILNEKNLDDTRKTRLEQSIKERLQKSGIESIGRKIEVKILTPNYLEDDEKDSWSYLPQEESDAIHDMIVNFLSASAEEIKERERHEHLESNYNFHLDDSVTQNHLGETFLEKESENKDVRSPATRNIATNGFIIEDPN